jgi:hypothetical protein
MKNSLLIALILLVSCGKNASEVTAEKGILNHERPEAISTKIALNDTPREIIVFAFPEQSEVADYYFDRSNSHLEEKDFSDLFSLVNYGSNYTFDITKDMTPVQKVQGLIGKVITISDARDNARRGAFEPSQIVLKTVRKVTEKLNSKAPCFVVTKRGHKNKGKCYLKPMANITANTPKILKGESCRDLEGYIASYFNLSPDENIPTAAETDYFLSSNEQPDLENDLLICKQNQEIAERFLSLAGLGKLEVATLVGSAEAGIKDKLLFKAASELDTVFGAEDKDSTVIFNPETLNFEKFSVAMDFFDGSGPAEYGPEHGNMTQPVISEINGSGFYRVDFEIKTPLFTLKTLGLSLELDPIFGLRISGKTKLYYLDGHTRSGIIRIDVSAKE